MFNVRPSMRNRRYNASLVRWKCGSSRRHFQRNSHTAMCHRPIRARNGIATFAMANQTDAYLADGCAVHALKNCEIATETDGTPTKQTK